MSYIIGGPGVTVVYARTADAAGAVAFTFKEVNQSALARGSDGVWTLTLENETDTAAFHTWLKTAVPPTSSSGVVEAERIREGGTKVGGGTAGAVEYVVVVAGGVTDNGSGADRKLAAFTMTVDPSSGGFTQKAGDPTKPAVVMKSYADSAITTVSVAVMNAITDLDGTTDLYEAAADITIPANAHYTIEFVPKYTP